MVFASLVDKTLKFVLKSEQSDSLNDMHFWSLWRETEELFCVTGIALD